MLLEIENHVSQRSEPGSNSLATVSIINDENTWLHLITPGNYSNRRKDIQQEYNRPVVLLN
jgi:hypothetical protein